MTEAVTPLAGSATQIVSAGVAVMAIPPNVKGGFITNPVYPSDQGIGYAEPLYIDPVGPCAQLSAGDTIVMIMPGETYRVIPGQTTPTFVNAATAGHRFTAIYW
ncbi:MAG: hypothetical protein N2444_00350 [Methylocystis sp.]|nr:hypothetical protein [Methylocystis sp.]